MKKEISQKAVKITWLLAMVYFASYLLRKNFAVMLAAITASGFDAVALGVVCSAMTVSYGAGQIVNGYLSDRIKPEIILTVGLAFSTLCNFSMFFCSTISTMVIVWFLNGFAQSMLWPPIVRLMTTYMNDSEYGYAAVRISCASSLATVLLYVLSPILLTVMGWRSVIACAAAIGLVITAVFVIYGFRLLRADVSERSAALSESEPISKDIEPTRVPRAVYIAIIPVLIAIMLQGALRDGVGDWMPTFFAEAFEIDVGNAILMGVIPSVFSIASFYLFDKIYQKFFKSEIKCAGFIFVVSLILALALLLFNLCLSDSRISAVVSAILISLVVMCVHGINLMLVVVLPKRFAKSGRVSTFSGIVNSATYLGSAVAMPLFPAISSSYGWNVTIGVWAVMLAFGACVCLVSALLWKARSRR